MTWLDIISIVVPCWLLVLFVIVGFVAGARTGEIDDEISELRH